MSKVKVLAIRAPGTNCDIETVFAFEQAGAEVSLVHVNRLIGGDEKLSDYQIMVIPGGFTYGDDIAAGKILANELRLKLAQDIKTFIEDGRLVLGICNGFQVLVKAGILPTTLKNCPEQLTVAVNDSGKFECRWVYLSVNETAPCIFTTGISHMYLPVAHGEGKVMADDEILHRINIVLQYADETGNTKAIYPYNPNGSMLNIAGICDESGHVFALMPHPERHVLGVQHPRWTREERKEFGDGFLIFQNAVKWAEKI